MTPLIRPGSDSRKNWRTINDHTVQLTGMDRRINAIDGERRQVYGGGSGGLLSYRVKSNLGDILICRRWNGTAEVGPEVFVAVNHQSRQLGSETINGITYTYTSYTDIGDGFNYTRISTSSADSSTESQIVTPMWYNNCVIAVTRIDFSGAAYHDLDADVMRDAKLIEVSARCWAKIADDEAPAPAPMAVAFPGDAMARLEKLEQSVGKSLKNAPTGRRGASRRVIA